MSLEPTESPSAEYTAIPSDKWEIFFDAFTKALEGFDVEIEVAGLDLGDQIQAESLPFLGGVTYDRKDDTFYVYVDDVDRQLAHAISHPREILVHWGGGAVDVIVVVDADAHQHFIRLRQPLLLPEHAT